MKSWNELTNLQRAVIGIAMVVAAAVLSEIAFLVQLGGMEVAFALVFASLAPIISWFSTKYQAIKEQMPSADDETIALLLAVNCLSTQLRREIEFDDKEQELEELRHKLVTCKQAQSKIEDSL